MLFEHHSKAPVQVLFKFQLDSPCPDTLEWPAALQHKSEKQEKQLRICLNNLSTDRWTDRNKSYVGIFWKLIIVIIQNCYYV